MKSQGKTETVKVAIRVRPMNTLEKKNNSTNCVEVNKSNNQVSVIKPETKEEKTFQYDYVYAPGTTQRQIYDETAFPLVESVFEGYNGTIFAYGQTGCGKTFTMMGDHKDPELRGVIPNTFSHIFGYISSEGQSKKFLVRCSFLEIYNEEIRDLLSSDVTKKMEVREDPKSGVFVKDLKMLQVKNFQEIEGCLNLGNKNRVVGETTMNQESSRSHCIFTIYVEIGENLEDQKNKKIKAGKLNLVDLAGSERQSKTGATGNRLDEAKKINLSLTALSNVINALVENKTHVPYRDSKLTRLLQDSLGGNTKTVMIAAISPSSFNFDETLGTLRYASRANAIKNAPKVNEDPKDTLLKQYEEEIKRLKEQIECGGGNQNNQNNERLQPLIAKPPSEDNYKKYESELKEKEQIIINSNLEKEKLISKIQDMEKELQKKLISGGDEKDEKEKKKFKDYRDKQIKFKEATNKKLEELEEKRKQEEESMQNDINKLRDKIKILQSEIQDLRYENERDREDIVESVKESNKESKLYHWMLKILLTDLEIKKIIELSRYNEESEEWRIHPFCLKEKKMQLPSIKPHQIQDFIENEHNARDLVIEESMRATNRNNKFLSNNRETNRDNRDMRETKQNFMKNIKANKFEETSSEFFKVEKKNINVANNSKNVQLDPIGKKQSIINTNINSSNSVFVLNRKEAKKFEDILKNTQNVNYELATSSNNVSQNTNSQQYHSVNKRASKIILDPINSNPFNKKIEVSFKATMQFSDDIAGLGNKIEISPNINLNNQNIMHINQNKKGRLDKISENKFRGQSEEIDE